MRQITIIGAGLIGGSFALAARKAGFTGRLVACDRPVVLARARSLGAFDVGFVDARQAVVNSDVVLLATPVGGILDYLEQAAGWPQTSLITDVGSTKLEIVQRARNIFGSAAAQRFLPGHPMAGKELSGLDQADADLFRGAVWLITPYQKQNLEQGSAKDFLELVSAMGARMMTLDPERHDRLCAWVSHLPQMVSTALAAALLDEFGDAPDLHAIGGRALREMTRIAASPYSMWRDIAFTNTANIADAIQHLEQHLAHLRENLKTRELEEMFGKGNEFRKQR